MPPWEPAAGVPAGVAHAEGGEDARRRARGGLRLGRHRNLARPALHLPAPPRHPMQRRCQPCRRHQGPLQRAAVDTRRRPNRLGHRGFYADDLAAQAAPTPSFWGVTPGESGQTDARKPGISNGTRLVTPRHGAQASKNDKFPIDSENGPEVIGRRSTRWGDLRRISRSHRPTEEGA